MAGRDSATKPARASRSPSPTGSGALGLRRGRAALLDEQAEQAPARVATERLSSAGHCEARIGLGSRQLEPAGGGVGFLLGGLERTSATSIGRALEAR